MQTEVNRWINTSVTLKKQLEHWATCIQQRDLKKLQACYHPKARIFPTFGSLKVGQKEVDPYLEKAIKTKVTLHFESLSYQIDENMVSGEYTFHRENKADVTAKFAFKFDSQGLIIEHASAPSATKTWFLKNEVSVCTLLTAATVKSVLKVSAEIPHSLTHQAIV